MRAALLLLDLQRDFLDRPGLLPPRAELLPRVARLLAGCREAGVPVLHVHTKVDAQGHRRMPHWKAREVWSCVEGTPGVLPDPAAGPRAQEPILYKSFYSAFGNPGLDRCLRALGVDTLVVAGVLLESCVRATVLDAYQAGYRIWLAEDAVGAGDALQAETTRSYLDDRACAILDSEEALRRLGSRPEPTVAADVPAACIGGRWHDALDRLGTRRLRDPNDPARDMAAVPLCGRADAAAACAAAEASRSGWEAAELEERRGLLRRWASDLEGDADAWLALLADEIGKPRREAREELERARAHVRAAAELELASVVHGSPSPVHVRYRPRGVIAVVTPWNNPVALPAGKLAAALACGNTVVWKPALQAPRCSVRLMDGLLRCGLPPGVVNLVFGDGRCVRQIVAHPALAAVTLTGSEATGRRLRALCAVHGRPLQAELGGNNAALVLADADLDGPALEGLARAAFGFAGQRCTAVRRFIVEESIAEAFERAFARAVASLVVGDPREEGTDVGPMISATERERIWSLVDGAVRGGARLLCGGQVPESTGGAPDRGHFLPAVLCDVAPDSALAREESFGPLALILRARDLAHAIELANAVPQGLVACVHTRSSAAREAAARALEVGILASGPHSLRIEPNAPFGGWKSSGLGPPEHGAWDREFHARPQTVYGHVVERTGGAS